VSPSMMMTIKDPAELSLMAGLYNPTSFQASPSCAYTFATLKIQNTVRFNCVERGLYDHLLVGFCRECQFQCPIPVI
jgi:hypothetical protein